jgi:peptidoglycan/LPS O-acetylase OafA/YrhL
MRIPALDGVRGLATLSVLLSHFWFHDVYGAEWWYKLAHSGWLGVDLFFVLSGMLITGILLRTKGQPTYFREFYRRRVLRIFPLYYAVLIYAALAILIIDRQPARLWQGYDSLGWFLAFIPNVAIALKNSPDWLWQTNWAGLNHLWSLAVEEQFYLVWPLVVLLLPRPWLGVVCVLMLAAGFPLRLWTDAQFGQEWSLAAYVLPYCRMDGLAAGSLLAVLQHGGHLTFRGWQRDLVRDAFVVLLICTLYLLLAAPSQARGSVAALMFGCFAYLAQGPGLTQRLCEHPLLCHFGQYSYGMYVFHQLLLMVYTWCFRQPLEATGMPIGMAQALYIALAFAATYGLARLSFRFIEQPFLAMK